MEEDDDDEVLAWKALEEHDDAHAAAEHHHQHSNHHNHHHGVGHAHSGGISTGTDDDVEDFAELAYAHHHARMTTATHPPHSLLQLQHEQEEQHGHDSQQQQLSQQQNQQSSQSQRFKRKNFSKQLQLICLQRYAQSAKEHGKLPDKTECQLLLHQSYLQFLKDGGAPDEPRLSHQEFLKLIRNRRREMYVRAQKLKFPHSSSSSSSTKATNSHTAASSSSTDTTGDAQPLSAAKRKLQEEHARIYELIEIIDQAREQSGLVSDHQQQQNQSARPVVRNGKRRLSNKSPSPLLSQQQQTIAHEHHHQQHQQMAADPNEQLHAIFRIQQETLEIQREIAERLKVIRLHRSLRQHDPMEPSSASV